MRCCFENVQVRPKDYRTVRRPHVCFAEAIREGTKLGDVAGQILESASFASPATGVLRYRTSSKSHHSTVNCLILIIRFVYTLRVEEL